MFLANLPKFLPSVFIKNVLQKLDLTNIHLAMILTAGLGNCFPLKVTSRLILAGI